MSKPIRILHVLQRMEAGGTQALLMNLYRNIDRNKIQFDFFVEYDYKEFYDDEIEKLGGHVYYSNVRRDFNILSFEKKLKNVIIQNDYKIVHVHTYSIGYFALKIAKKCGVPVRIAHSHNNETVRDKKYLLKLFMQKIYTLHATDLFACSESAGNYLFRKKKFNILNNAIDSTKFIYDEGIRNKIRKELNVEDNFVVGHVGRLHAQKNHKKLINIFKIIKEKRKNAKLVLVGTGPLETEIKNQVDQLGLKNDVLFLGNKSNVNEIYQGFDVFVLPSLFEGLGIVAVEAQASGLPVIVSNGVSNDAMITSNIKKISLEESDYKWAEEVLNFYVKQRNDNDILTQIKKNGFDIETNIKNIESYYIDKYENK